jgi:hypothetical protein
MLREGVSVGFSITPLYIYIASFLIAFLRRLEPFFLRETRRCANFSLRLA